MFLLTKVIRGRTLKITSSSAIAAVHNRPKARTRRDGLIMDMHPQLDALIRLAGGEPVIAARGNHRSQGDMPDQLPGGAAPQKSRQHWFDLRKWILGLRGNAM